MSNLLNRLAGRALGVIPVAEPIVPARFSPVVRQHGSLDWLVGDVEQEAATPQASLGEMTAQNQDVGNQLPPSSRSTKRERRSEDEVSRTPVLRPRRRVFETDSTSTSELSNRKPDELDERLPQIELSPRREKPSNHSAHDRVISDAGQVEPSSIRAGRDHPSKQPFTPLRPESASVDAFLDRPTGAAPSIKVTIGRIDVRAVTPPAPQATPHRRSSTLSLEQFLKQRSAG